MQDAIETPPTTIDEEPLTPREARLERAARWLRWGGIINGILAGILVLIAIFAAAQGAGGFFSTLRQVVFFNYSGADDVALLGVLLLLLINTSFLLVLMVGVLAQEFWSLIVALLLLVANAAFLILLGFTPALLSVVAVIGAAVILVPDLRALRANPVMLKELRERMRGARAFAVITVYLALMSGFAILLFLVNTPFGQGISSAVTGDLGRTLFAGVIGLELLLIIFIAPAFTAGAITGERERKTYDLLQITLLPRPSFVIGKLESALGYIFLLLLAAIPLQSIAFLFGGVTETELILAFVILTVTAITLGTVGLFFSTVADRTLTASVRAYTVAMGMLVGVPIVAGLIIGTYNAAVAGSGTGFNGPPVIEAGLIYLGAFLTSLNPITTATSTQQLLISQQQVGFWNATLSSNGGTIPLASPWISFTIIYLVVSAVLIVLSIRRIRRSEF